jgi:L,D-transpeptidase ErfK/SrfK
MRQRGCLPQAADALRLVLICLFLVFLNACAVTKGVVEKSSLTPNPLEKDIEHNTFQVAGGTDVIGRLAVVRLEKGDTLPDIARHFSLGVNAISEANPSADVWVPKAGELAVLPLSFVLPDAPRKGIVVNLATMRLFHFKRGVNSFLVSTYPVGVGTEERPTPTGRMHVERKAIQPTWFVPASIYEDHRKKGDLLPAQVPPGPQNPLGERALYLSKHGYLIHGTNKPASIGLKATNGCLRLYPENVKMLFDETAINTPVVIVNQPYLIGQRDGVLYLEAHKPFEVSGAAELERMLAKLRKMARKLSHTIDWNKVKEVVAEARGIPVAISETDQEGGKKVAKTVEVEHPPKLYGRPEIPELKQEGWYLVAASVRDEIDADRIAAMINHQGPQIPARVLARRNGYRVIAGPFKDVGEAKDAARRLKVDLEIEGVLVEPVMR